MICVFKILFFWYIVLFEHLLFFSLWALCQRVFQNTHIEISDMTEYTCRHIRKKTYPTSLERLSQIALVCFKIIEWYHQSHSRVQGHFDVYIFYVSSLLIRNVLLLGNGGLYFILDTLCESFNCKRSDITLHTQVILKWISECPGGPWF